MCEGRQSQRIDSSTALSSSMGKGFSLHLMPRSLEVSIYPVVCMGFVGTDRGSTGMLCVLAGATLL